MTTTPNPNPGPDGIEINAGWAVVTVGPDGTLTIRPRPVPAPASPPWRLTLADGAASSASSSGTVVEARLRHCEGCNRDLAVNKFPTGGKGAPFRPAGNCRTCRKRDRALRGNYVRKEELVAALTRKWECNDLRGPGKTRWTDDEMRAYIEDLFDRYPVGLRANAEEEIAWWDPEIEMVGSGDSRWYETFNAVKRERDAR